MTIEQKQRQVEVRMSDGTILTGAATGNNAAWLCNCESQQLLVGRTPMQDSQGWKVQCRSCEKIYKLCPENGKIGGKVAHVEECKL